MLIRKEDTVMKFLEKLWADNLGSAILTIIIGLLITLLYKFALDMVCIIMGAVSVIIGVVLLIKYFRAPENQNRVMLLLSLILGAIGAYIIIHPETFLSMIAVVFGIFIIYNAIIDLQSTIKMKKGGYVYWYASLIISLITLASGIVLVLLRNKAADAVALTAGIMLIVQGIMNIWVAVKVKKFNE